MVSEVLLIKHKKEHAHSIRNDNDAAPFATRLRMSHRPAHLLRVVEPLHGQFSQNKITVAGPAEMQFRQQLWVVYLLVNAMSHLSQKAAELRRAMFP